MNQPYDGEERRQHNRSNAKFLLNYRVDDPIKANVIFGSSDIDAVMNDIGEGGAGLLTDYNIPVGTEISINFTLINSKEVHEKRMVKMSLTGEVRHCSSKNDIDYHVGIRFTHIPESKKEAIRKFIEAESAALTQK